jgi:hypothetical protein
LVLLSSAGRAEIFDHNPAVLHHGVCSIAFWVIAHALCKALSLLPSCRALRMIHLKPLRFASVAQVPKPEVLELTARAKDSAAAQMAVKLYETAVSGGDVGGIKPYVHTLPSLEHNVQLICCSIGCLIRAICPQE